MDDALTIAGVRRLHDGGQGSWMKLNDGTIFRALVANHPPVEIDTDLNYDASMANIMEVLNERVPQSLRGIGAKANVPLFDTKTNTRWQICQRNDTPMDCTTQFVILKSKETLQNRNQ